MTDTADKAECDALQSILETYGADRKRWPEDAMQRFPASRIAQIGAHGMVRDAIALHALLNRAGAESQIELEILTDKIVQAAMCQPRLIPHRDTPAEMTVSRPPISWVWRDHGWTAAALAASLVLGVLAGESSTISPVADAFVAGTAASDEAPGQNVARNDDSDANLDEDLL